MQETNNICHFCNRRKSNRWKII